MTHVLLDRGNLTNDAVRVMAVNRARGEIATLAEALARRIGPQRTYELLQQAADTIIARQGDVARAELTQPEKRNVG